MRFMDSEESIISFSWPLNALKTFLWHCVHLPSLAPTLTGRDGARGQARRWLGGSGGREEGVGAGGGRSNVGRLGFVVAL